MENRFSRPDKPVEKYSAVKIETNDALLFGQLLLASRIAAKKSRRQIAQELGLKSDDLIRHLELGENFLEEEMLPAIANAYGLDIGKLTEALRISKEARQREKEAKKSPKPKPRRPAMGEDFGFLLGGSTNRGHRY